MDNEHHRELHEWVISATRLADWIYHDVRLDCDGEALDRTVERLNYIKDEHGFAGLFGVAGAWVTKAIYRLEDAYAMHNRKLPKLQSYLSKDVQPEALSTRGRGNLAANQFTVAVGNDDLEMAEAIFGAAHDASDDDLSAFLAGALNLSIEISKIAKTMIAEIADNPYV